MSRLSIPVTQRDHLRGSLRDAAVVLVEYGDYECPHCAAAQPMVDSLSVLLGERLCTAFRHFPLSQIHPHAQRAAEAAEAAGAQSMFWQMHELMFEQQQMLDDASLIQYADEIGLDVERFARELRAGVHERRVHEDFMGGVRSGVNGTPTFFIDGVRYDGPYELESLLAALQGASGEHAVSRRRTRAAE